MRFGIHCLLAGMLLAPVVAAAEPVVVAVASNFAQTAAKLGEDFERRSGIEVRFSSGSTGKLYAQIVNGAPFDVFLAADRERPSRLVRAGFADEVLDYAVGTVALISMTDGIDDCIAALDRAEFTIAIANPETAPYGAAARAFLDSRRSTQVETGRIAVAESVAQALHFVVSGNAQLGFVATTLIGTLETSCRYDLPAGIGLTQRGVLLHRAHATGPRAFLDYLASEPARAIIVGDGYLLPEANR